MVSPLFSHQIYVASIAGQVFEDTFSAKGTIDTTIYKEIDLGNQIKENKSNLSTDKNKIEYNYDTENNNLKEKSIDLQNTQGKNNEPSLLQGEWILEVRKGDPENFQAIFSLIQNDKIVNVFAIYNLRDTGYIHLNDQGTKIISGKVDFKSSGIINETRKDMDATIALVRLTEIRINMDKNKLDYFNENPVIGNTRLFIDAAGNMITAQQSPNSAQSNK